MNKLLKTIGISLVIALTGCSDVKTSELQDAVNPINDKNYSLAIQKLSALREKYPKNPQILYFMAYARLYSNNYKKALKRVDQTLELAPNYSHVIGDVGMANFLAGNSPDTGYPYFKLAVRELQKIIGEKKGTEDADRIQFHLAHYSFIKKDYRRALREFKKVLDQKPDNTEYDVQARLQLGTIYLSKLDQEDEGLSHLQYVIDHFPKSRTAAEAWFYIASHHEEKMRVFEKRYRSLQDFAKRWKNDSRFVNEVKSALDQSQKDRQLAAQYRSRAVTSYQKIFTEYGQSVFSTRAKDRLARIEG